MSSKFSTFICQNCGSETSQYFGRCLNCNEWNTIVEERKNPSVLNGNRKKRIAKGSGTSVVQVNQLIKQFSQMGKMMKMMQGGGKQQMLQMLQGKGGFPQR